MTNESQEDRAYYDKRIQESRILSQLYANRLSHHDRAKKLLREVETYQTRVLVRGYGLGLCFYAKAISVSKSKRSAPRLASIVR